MRTSREKDLVSKVLVVRRSVGFANKGSTGLTLVHPDDEATDDCDGSEAGFGEEEMTCEPDSEPISSVARSP